MEIFSWQLAILEVETGNVDQGVILTEKAKERMS